MSGHAEGAQLRNGEIEGVRVFVCVGDRYLRDGLVSVLESSGRAEVVGVACGAAGGLDTQGLVGAEVAVLDASLDDVLGLIRRIRREQAHVQVLIVGVPAAAAEVVTYLEAGAYATHDTADRWSELLAAIERAARGEVSCTPEVAYRMFARLAELAERREQLGAIESMELSPRELQVLELVAEGLTNGEIAKRLYLSVHTVKNHVRNILHRLDMTSRWEAVEVAYARKWLRRPSYF